MWKLFRQPDSTPAADAYTAAKRPPDPIYQVCFSPRGGVADMVIAELGKATESVYLAGYSFDAEPIARALIAARNRGPHVEIVIDKSNLHDSHSQAQLCAGAGIDVWVDSVHAIFHNKFIVIDRSVVIMGSYNWSRNAELANAENCVVLRLPALAALYEHNWQIHRAHSTKLPAAPAVAVAA